MRPLQLLFAFFYVLAYGSFLNVFHYRWPRGISLRYPALELSVAILVLVAFLLRPQIWAAVLMAGLLPLLFIFALLAWHRSFPARISSLGVIVSAVVLLVVPTAALLVAGAAVTILLALGFATLKVSYREGKPR